MHIDRRNNSINLNKEKIIELGKRTNIGFDQIIFIEKEINNTFPITIYNSDGNLLAISDQYGNFKFRSKKGKLDLIILRLSIS